MFQTRNNNSGQIKCCESLPGYQTINMKNQDLRRQNSSVLLKSPLIVNASNNNATRCNIRVISIKELSDILLCHTSIEKSVVVIDARYPYEYQCGHIVGSYNVQNMKQLEKLTKMRWQNALFIIYCDKSTTRSKIIASCISRVIQESNHIGKSGYNQTKSDRNILILEDDFKTFANEYPCLMTGVYVNKVDKKYTKNGLYKKYSDLFRKEFLMEDTKQIKNDVYKSPRKASFDAFGISLLE
ncbi:hypothetical protein TRFO_26167 [Tritrichomonas foetus]|uniref:Rhodanese domain-containing protein n=1 Tax=Tritrichomonas foetus TaxID=1144522 RepID=A0A1J4K4K2_9EUKA|nr:hypothetical protein TRFO_26167 [Tritrichomonas foetus]|eukprot:OHT05898.1 hypothetical protein TRFO_26167 [Tritrichomonas foetus]